MARVAANGGKYFSGVCSRPPFGLGLRQYRSFELQFQHGFTTIKYHQVYYAAHAREVHNKLYWDVSSDFLRSHDF